MFSVDVTFVNCCLTSELQEITERRDREKYFIELLGIGIKIIIKQVGRGFTHMCGFDYNL